ncbi:MAG: Gfo/Idh/MocA family protein [Gaiellaceae bacterium]
MVVGLVGCGHWGVNILRDLRTLDCDVRVVVRSDASVARAREGGAAAVVPEIAELGAVDGIVTCTPIETHAAVIEEALAADVPVFTEKPLCDDAGDAARLAALAPDRLFVMDKWRYHAGIGVIADIAATGRFGSVHGLRTVRVQPDNRHAEDAIWVLSPHDLVIALEVLGEVPRPRAASGQWAEGRLITMHALLETDRGWHALEVSERAPATERRIELHCDEGVAVLGGGWDEHVLVHLTRGRTERLEAPGELPLLAELRAFVGFLDGGLPPKSSAAEGAAVVEVIAALRALAA